MRRSREHIVWHLSSFLSKGRIDSGCPFCVIATCTCLLLGFSCHSNLHLLAARLQLLSSHQHQYWEAQSEISAFFTFWFPHRAIMLTTRNYYYYYYYCSNYHESIYHDLMFNSDVKVY